MTNSTIPPLICCLALLVGCAAQTPVTAAPEPLPPNTQYDSVLTDGHGQLMSVNQLAKELQDYDVVVVGEYHGHHAAHLLQSLLQSALYRQNPQQVLSMEQFALDHQEELNAYLAGDSGEAEMIEDADAWSNYTASYRPLVEFAKARSLPVVAANAPAGIVRCVGRQGMSYLESLPEATQDALPDQPLTEPDGYRQKFKAALGHGHGGSGDDGGMSERMRNSYQAQLLRDNTMAKRVIEAATEKPDHQILHLTGTFHSEGRLGTVAVIEERRPELSVAVISPIVWEPGQRFAQVLDGQQNKGDFLYLIQPLPTEYTDPERRREAIMAQFQGASEKTCE